MNGAQLAFYAASKGYSVMTDIQPGQGFWINTRQSVTLPVSGGTAFGLPAADIMPQWNLVATGVATEPAQLNDTLGSPDLDYFKSLWAWDNPAQQWYFYAPSLDRQGSLKSYQASQGYLDFGLASKKLGHGVGFWINR